MSLNLILLLVSLAIVAGGIYYADKRNREQRALGMDRVRRNRFKEINNAMPELIREMRADLSYPQNKLVRKFFIVSKEIEFESKGSLVYYTEDHPDLEAKVEILENGGYITDITPYNVKEYRMSEEFVALVLQTGAPPVAGTNM
jgi:hypothetical protein